MPTAASPQLPEHVPQQARSRQTRERILDATEAELQDRVFDDLTIAEIMDRAGMAVGTFYRRFPTKEALLPYLYERYEQGLANEVETFLEPEDWVGVGLVGRVERLVEFAVRTYRCRRGLWRAVLVHAIARPAAIGEGSRRDRLALVNRFLALLIECAEEIGHPEPRFAAELAITSLMSVCKDRILLDTPGSRTSRPVSDLRLRRELGRMILGYLGWTGGRAR